MGAVRIYKELHADEFGINPWQVRSEGCEMEDANECDYGRRHGGYCDGFFEHKWVLKHLNDPTSDLGEYISE